MAAKIEQEQGPKGLQTKQVLALIAYLERLGVDLFATPTPYAGSAQTAQASDAQAAR